MQLGKFVLLFAAYVWNIQRLLRPGGGKHTFTLRGAWKRQWVSILILWLLRFFCDILGGHAEHDGGIVLGSVFGRRLISAFTFTLQLTLLHWTLLLHLEKLALRWLLEGRFGWFSTLLFLLCLRCAFHFFDSTPRVDWLNPYAEASDRELSAATHAFRWLVRVFGVVSLVVRKVG